jgi:hypothetical protein
VPAAVTSGTSTGLNVRLHTNERGGWPGGSYYFCFYIRFCRQNYSLCYMYTCTLNIYCPFGPYRSEYRVSGRGSPPNLPQGSSAHPVCCVCKMRISACTRTRSGQQEIPRADWAGCRVRAVDLKSEDSGWLASRTDSLLSACMHPVSTFLYKLTETD